MLCRHPLTKLALLEKLRTDGTRKYRLIWDMRRSGVNLVIGQNQRIVLPRLSDLAADMYDLSQHSCEGEES